jgi:adenylate cyclase
VPKLLVRDLLASGQGIQRGGESRPVTVMFVDIVEFSSIAERVTPQSLTARVSAYFDEVTGEIVRNQGQIDKYIGDSVMALWNAPVDDPDHIEHACSAALHVVRVCRHSNEEWTTRGWEPLRMRVGMHTAPVFVGVIGSAEYMSYTALGDGVNIASRLEGINKVFGTDICVSQSIYLAMRDQFLMRPLGNVTVKGRREAVLTYELMARLDGDPLIGASAADLERARLTEEAFAAWSGGLEDKALKLYGALLERFPGDPVALYYLARQPERVDQDAVAA